MVVTKRLILVRHGELPEEYRGRFIGRTDPPLSASGRAAVAALQPRFAAYAPRRVYAGTLRRAWQSARLLAGDAVIPEERLREIDFGLFENLTFAEIDRRYPELTADWMRAPAAMRFPEGGDMRLHRRGIAAFLEEKIFPSAETAALVTHGGVLPVVLAEVLHIPLEAAWQLQMARGSMSVIEFGAERRGRLTVFNLTAEMLKTENGRVL